MKTICAWCLKEKGIKSKSNESHGICKKHQKELLNKMKGLKKKENN